MKTISLITGAIHPDGGALRQLTQNAGDNDQPAWSPDGSLIAFVSGRGGSSDIWTMSVDGSNLRRVTTFAGLENHPSFSPSGTEIVFSHLAGAEYLRLSVRGADASKGVGREVNSRVMVSS